MSNVINFPNEKERITFKRNIANTKRYNIFKSILQLVSKAIYDTLFTIRLTIATTLHYSFCVFLSILNSMNVFLFFFLGLCCIINYFHLGQHFVSPTNYVTPVFIGFWILSCSAQHLVSLIQEHLPFHRICRV
ncbi:Unknown (plasmid) [Rickettsia africae ESF-5]|uniref:Uncharacterized protein n=1 Tax=Rickettsia africae (strain ESF-5) TaxID=347255 RepID=C3PPD8_RICAE|nr:Unknown [Rickettsia africae ESF-5]